MFARTFLALVHGIGAVLLLVLGIAGLIYDIPFWFTLFCLVDSIPMGLLAYMFYEDGKL